MGYYVNHPELNHQEFLAVHGITISPDDAVIDDNYLPCALADNGAFTALAIGYSQAEIDHFKASASRRPVTWYLVPREQLAPFLPS